MRFINLILGVLNVLAMLVASYTGNEFITMMHLMVALICFLAFALGEVGRRDD